MACLFDRKFGKEFIKSVPLCPGVYEMLDAQGTVIYVGKAKNLRRRLQQYRNARRRKKHLKMRSILKEAVSARFTSCATDLEALLLENSRIQQLRPRFNIAGTFSFMYPVLGVARSGLNLDLVYTTTPGEFTGLKLYGSYRSRRRAREAFFALSQLLEFIGHREPAKVMAARLPRVKYSFVAGFRQIEERWLELLHAFLTGQSLEFMEKAILVMVEKPMARKNSEEIQERIDELRRFFRFEAKPLREAMTSCGIAGTHLPQAERDQVFLKAWHRDERVTSPDERPQA